MHVNYMVLVVGWKLGGGSGWNRSSSGKQREYFRCGSSRHLAVFLRIRNVILARELGI